MSWMILSAVAVGGAIGACTRYLVTMQMTAWLGYGFPYGTLSVNIVGGLIMGILTELIATRWSIGTELRFLLTTGFLGGLTTFSTFSLDAVLLIEQKNMLLAALYIGGSVILSITAVVVGIWIVRQGGS